MDMLFYKSEPEQALWFGVKGFRYSGYRNSPTRGKVLEKGWYFYLYVFNYELVIWR